MKHRIRLLISVSLSAALFLAAACLSGVAHAMPATIAWEVKTSTTLGDADLTTYNGDVQVNAKDGSGNPVKLDLNGKAVTINGNLNIFGTLDVHNGSLKVTGSVTVMDGILKITESSNSSCGLVIVYGNFVTDGRDHTGMLTAGMLDVRGDFIQYANYSPKAFCPTGDFKVKLTGTNKILYFDTPMESWLGKYEFVNATFKTNSVFSFNLNMTADATMSYSKLYLRGSMNGKKLTVTGTGGAVIAGGSLTPGGGRLEVGGPLEVAASGGILMNNANDTIKVNGNFATKGLCDCRAGTLEINGNFAQYGLVTGFPDGAFTGRPEHLTKITGTGRKIRFDTPVTSYFGRLEVASVTDDSTVSLNCNLTADTTWTFPVVYYGGSMNGFDLTVTKNLFARQIRPGGGTLTAKQNFTSIAQDCLVMTNANDSVVVEGNFISNQPMSEGSLTAGTLEIKGNFTQSGQAAAFIATGTHKTKLTGANKQVVFANPGTSWFNRLELSPGTTITAGSVLSVKCDLAADTVFTAPVLYYSGSMGGHDLAVTGDLHLFGAVNPQGASITATGSVTLDGVLTMASDDDMLVAGLDFTGSGTAALSAGRTEFRRSFRYTGSSWQASGTHTTRLAGGARMPVVFSNPQASWFAGVELAAGMTFSADSAVSVKRAAGQPDIAWTVPMLYLQGSLDGQNVAVTGSAAVPAGATLTVGTGSLAASGNMTLDGLLEMTNANGVVEVGGSFTARGPDSSGKLTAGRLVLKGDFSQLGSNSQKSFHATAGSAHATVFAGSGTQHVSFASPGAAASRFAKLYSLNPDVSYDTEYVCDSYTLTSAKLLSLSGLSGTLVPSFSPNVRDYICVLPKGTTGTTITARSEFINATLNDQSGADPYVEVVSDVPYSGFKTVTIVVKAKDNVASATYTIKVEQLNLDLQGIGLDDDLPPLTFDRDTLNYTVNLPAAKDTVTLVPLTDHPDTACAIKVNNIAVPSGEIAVKPGETVVVKIETTGQNGTSHKVYTVTVNREEVLTGIAASVGTLSPAWSSPVADYTLRLTALQSSVTLTPGRAAGCDRLLIDGVERDSAVIEMNLGQTKTVNITVEAGETTFTYHISIIRAPIISGFGQSPRANTVLSPSFDAEHLEYSLAIPASMINVSITPAKGQDCTKLIIDEDASNGIVLDDTNKKDTVMLTLPVGGSRVLTIRAEAGAGLSRTYTLTVTKGQIIGNLTMSQGSLSPSFSPLTNAYSVRVPATSGPVSVTPTLLSGSAAINGMSFSPSSPVTVNPAPGETATLTVVGSDGNSSATYTITVTRDKPVDGIGLPEGTRLQESFDARTGDYDVLVPASRASVTVTPHKTAGCLSLSINGAVRDSVTLTPGIGGKATAEIAATGPDGVTVTRYRVTVLREALLADINLSAGTLAPDFDGGSPGYNVFVPNNVTAVTVTPVKSASCKSFTINNGAVGAIVLKPVSGGMAAAVIKAVGDTSAITQTFTVRVFRVAPVTAIKLSTGALSPAFDINRSGYIVDIPASTGSVTITPVLGYSCSNMLIDGVKKSAVTLAPKIGCSLSATVTAEARNGQDFTYTITVRRAPLLRGITAAGGTLSPAFRVSTLNYTVSIPATTASVKITPLKAATGVYSMTINGRAVTSVTLSPAAGCAATATIKLTSSVNRAVTQTYTVIVRRAPLITLIGASAGSMSPAFSTDKTGYTLTIPVDTTATTVTVTKAASGVKSVTMNGRAVTSLPVTIDKPGGSVTVTIVALATDNRTKSTYTVTVKRAPVLNGITVAGGTLSPAFSATAAGYTVSIPATAGKVKLTPVRAPGCTSVTIDGAAANSKEYTLPVGGSVTTTITGKTDAGTTSTYKVTIRKAALVTGIRTSLSTSPVSPAFSATTLGYTVNLPATRTSVTVYATVAAGVKSLTMNGRAVTSLLVKPAVGGSTVVVITALASDGRAKVTYRVTVKRAGLLSNISADGGAALSPAFNAATKTYTVIIPATRSQVKITATGTASAKTIKINGAAASSVTLKPAVGGSATAVISVTAADGVTKDAYTVVVRRVTPLTGITLPAGLSLSPAFRADVTSYTVAVPAGTTSVVITPAKVAGSSFRINGEAVAFKQFDKPAEGNTVTVTIVATASDGVTNITYTVTLVWPAP